VFDGGVVAVHLRRTCKLLHDPNHEHLTTKPSELADIMGDLMTDLIARAKKGEVAKVYVCSDDPQAKRSFIEDLKTAWGKEPALLARPLDILALGPANLPGTLAMVQGAFEVMEMCCMSLCTTVLQGIKYSTYSIVATMVSQRPLVNYFRSEVKNWNLHIWRPCLVTEVRFASDDRFLMDNAEAALRDCLPIRM